MELLLLLLLLVFFILFIIFLPTKIKELCDLILFDTVSSCLLYLYKKHISSTYKGYDIIGDEYFLESCIRINKDYDIYYKNLPLKDKINIKIKVVKVLSKIKRNEKKEIKDAFKNKKSM